MAKFKNFTLEGKAFNITAYIAQDGKTAYLIELNPKFDERALTWEAFNEFRKAIKDDADVWSGIVNDHVLDDFEDAWKEDSDV